MAGARPSFRLSKALMAAMRARRLPPGFAAGTKVHRRLSARCTDGPILIRLDEIDERPGSTHTLCGFARFMSSGMTPLKPRIRKRLHAVQNLFLVFPKTVRIFSKWGRNCGSWQKHLLHGGPLFSQIRI